MDLLPRQRQAGGSAPIALLGKSDSPSSFRLYLRARTPAGRGLVRMESEVKPLGVPFDGVGVETAMFARTTTPNSLGSYLELWRQPQGLAMDTPYRWRLRVASPSPYFPHGMWLTQPENNLTESDLRTGGSTNSIPPAGAATAGAFLLSITPNPLREQARIRYAVPSSGPVRLAVYDLGGRRVASLVETTEGAGEHAVVWDGRDAHGRPVAPGVYFARSRRRVAGPSPGRSR